MLIFIKKLLCDWANLDYMKPETSFLTNSLGNILSASQFG